MDKLVAFYRRAMVDWRTPLADGTLRHRKQAFSHDLGAEGLARRIEHLESFAL